LSDEKGRLYQLLKKSETGVQGKFPSIPITGKTNRALLWATPCQQYIKKAAISAAFLI
jgi:hypothetical protein